MTKEINDGAIERLAISLAFAFQEYESKKIVSALLPGISQDRKLQAELIGALIYTYRELGVRDRVLDRIKAMLPSTHAYIVRIIDKMDQAIDKNDAMYNLDKSIDNVDLAKDVLGKIFTK